MTDWQDALNVLHSTCLKTFGVPVIYTPSLENRMELGGTPVTLTGIFDDRQEDVVVMSEGSAGMGAVIPRRILEIKIADLGFAPMAGDEVVIEGASHRIQEVRTDGTGMAILHLAQKYDPFAAF